MFDAYLESNGLTDGQEFSLDLTLGANLAQARAGLVDLVVLNQPTRGLGSKRNRRQQSDGRTSFQRSVSGPGNKKGEEAYRTCKNTTVFHLHSPSCGALVVPNEAQKQMKDPTESKRN